MSTLYRGPSIDVSYQVSVHLTKGFQRRRLKCEKLTDDRRRTTSDGKKLLLPLARWAKKTYYFIIANTLMVCLLICFLYVHIYNKINCELMLTYDTPAYMFNMYKNQLSRQTGSRNLTGPKTLPTIWHTYMKLVIKYQISAINSCWEKCDKKYLGRTEGRTEVKQYTPPPPVERGYKNILGSKVVILLSFQSTKKKAQSCIGISINYFCEFGANLWYTILYVKWWWPFRSSIHLS
jgi:hypothetical protein